jgi:hypothetical protein
MYCDICWHLRNVSERGHIPDGAEIRVLRLCPFPRDGVVVESDFLHTELRLASFDLDARPLAAANESFKKFMKLLKTVRTSTDVVAIYRKLVSQGFQITLSILEAVAIAIHQVFPESAVLI